jgi:hypothetical protein
VKDDQPAVFDDMVGMFQDGIELDRFPGHQMVGLPGKRNLHRSLENPANFKVITMDFRTGQVIPGLALSVQAFDVVVYYFIKGETALGSMADLFPMGGPGLGQCHQIRRAHIKNPGNAKQGFQFRDGLISFQFGK